MVLSDTIQQTGGIDVFNGVSLTWESTFDAVKEMVMIVDERFLVVRANRAVVEFLGKPMEEITGKSCRELFHESSVPPKDCPLLQIKQKKAHIECEFFLKEKNTWIESVVDPIFDQSGMLVGSVHVLRDVTDHKTIQEKLRAASRYTRNLIETSLDPLVTISPSGIITDVNTATEQVTGVSREKLIGSDFCDYFTEPDKARRGYKQVLSQGVVKEYLLTIQHSSGRTTDVIYNASVYKNEAGEIQGIFAAARDITERRKVEEALRENEGLLRGLFENMTSGAAIYKVINDGSKGSDYIIRAFNVVSLRIEGKQKDEVIGKSLFDLRPNIDQYGLISIFQKVWRTGEPGYFPSTIYVDKKYSNWYENRVFKLPTGEIVAIYDDVTERKNAEEEIKRLAKFPSENPSPVLRITKDGTVVYCNEAGIQVLDFWQTNIGGTAPERWCNIIRKKFASQNLKAEEEEEEEEELKDKVFSFVVAPIADEGYVNLYGRDITERKKIELELKDSEERYKKITEGLSDYLYTVFVENGQVISTVHSKACGAVTGYSSEEFKADPYLWIHMVPVEERDLVREYARKILAGEKIKAIEHRIIRKDGEVRLVIDTPILHFNEQKRFVSYDGIIKDITERKKAEEKLRETQERYQSLYDRSLEMVYLCDFQGRFIDANPTALKLLGYTKEELTSLTIISLLDQEQSTQAFQMLETLKLTGYQSQPKEYKIRCKNGQYIYVETVSSLVYQDGMPVAIQGTARNITEQKLADEQLKEAHRIVSIMNTELEQQVKQRTEQIENLLKQKDEFIQMLGHDLKNPLTPLVTLLPIIERKEQDVKQKELLQIVLRNVQIMKELVEKTIKLAILSEPTTHFETQSLLLNSEVEKTLNVLGHMFQEHHIAIENHISDNLIVNADPLRLREILDNLFTNSVKFSPAGGKITVDAQSDNDMVVISVKDTGIGITAEQMPHIFEEFYKGDSSRHDLDSSGLGLPICKRIVEKHGGKIWVESPGKDKGSTIFFTLHCVKKSK